MRALPIAPERTRQDRLLGGHRRARALALCLAALFSLPAQARATVVEIYWCRFRLAPEEAIKSLWQTQDGSLPVGLGYLGRCARPARDAPAVPHLMPYMASTRPPQRRWLAVRALARLGPTAATATSLLTPLLNEEDDRLRLAASVAILRVAPEHDVASKARRHLERALASRDHGVRRAAVEVVGALGGEGLELLPASPAFGEWEIYTAFAEIGTAQAVDHLFSGLQEEEPIMADRAARALSEVGDYGGPEAAMQLADRLRRALADPAPALRAGAARTLYYLGSAGWSESRPCVTDAHEPPGCPTIRGAVDSLVVLLADPESRVRTSAAVALDRLGPGAASALSSIVAALNREDVAAPEALTMANTAAAIALPIPTARRGVERLFAHKDGGFRMYAARALRDTATTSPWALALLRRGLNDPSLHVRVDSAHALGKISGDLSPVVPVLAEAHSATTSAEIRSWIERVVEDLGPDAEALMPTLTSE